MSVPGVTNEDNAWALIQEDAVPRFELGEDFLNNPSRIAPTNIFEQYITLDFINAIISHVSYGYGVSVDLTGLSIDK